MSSHHKRPMIDRNDELITRSLKRQRWLSGATGLWAGVAIPYFYGYVSVVWWIFGCAGFVAATGYCTLQFERDRRRLKQLRAADELSTP